MTFSPFNTPYFRTATLKSSFITPAAATTSATRYRSLRFITIMATSFSPTATAEKATTFKSLHRNIAGGGKPLLLANVYDATSARVVASLPGCAALATASFALAQSIGKTDETLTLDENLSLARPIAAVANEFNLPLTVDIQDGYAPRGDKQALVDVTAGLVKGLGAVGVNLEDSWHETCEMMDEEYAVERISIMLSAAADLGVSDFVVNARSDTFLMGGSLDESIRRGKKYLEAGAETVFIFWPRGEAMKREDVQRVIDELDGRVNISCRLGQKGGLTTADLAAMGAARVSVGPQLYLAVAETLKKAAGAVFAV
ncbi:phosphoenolpyruvate phosphomutase-domain-containing protein [Apodospora peruviana]|uniref:Phosphoenolpyruvate phosphomutase-domain-containing protein n=1 Tax=Apodospora peruviana TaxID=516989 RepID=A0AAE0MBD7_9PEZI|nr:phosphoenolpyruvate phosphomutase-domain-containing protein [Apodospora peruviana]